MSKSLLVALLLIAPAHADTDSRAPQAELNEAQAQVEERRDDLAEAWREGDEEQIRKEEGELADALKDLGEAQAE